MHARGVSFSVFALVLFLVACGSKEEKPFEPPPPDSYAVQWSITGDLQSQAKGDLARLLVPTGGSDARLSLSFEVQGGSTLILSGPAGDLRVRKAQFVVNDTLESGWHGHLIMRSADTRQDFRTDDSDGLLVFTKVNSAQVEGTLNFPACETDEAGADLPQGKHITMAAIFSAQVQSVQP
jgi:hypothetical protein